jgi:8-oxo-dGTP pyrophosphatase MutT (NUDIX family)
MRDGADGPELFMVRRHQDTAFMGGAYVFPGGRVDPGDHDGDDTWCDGAGHATAQLADLPRGEALAYHVAAVRELFEEAGVLLARDAAGSLIDLSGDEDRSRFNAYRTDIHAGRATMRAVVERERLRLALDLLVMFAHWVTPPIDTRQFDTRFFLTRLPPHQSPIHDDTETTHSDWLTPSAALARSLASDIVLPPPTWTTIRELERFASVDDALGWARARRVTRRQPMLIMEKGVRVLLVPGDPGHPDEPGDDPPVETRFVFRDRRWHAERPRV